jgi:ABC-type branched-subunit amino acid transport system substrate-binding protein
MRKPILHVSAILIILSLALAACGGGATPVAVEDEWGLMTFAPGTEIKIGVSSALAGGYAVYGQDMLNGVDLAIEDFGNLKGWTVKSEGGDDGCEGAPGVTVAELFSADPAILGVVGPMCSP